MIRKTFFVIFIIIFFIDAKAWIYDKLRFDDIKKIFFKQKLIYLKIKKSIKGIYSFKKVRFLDINHILLLDTLNNSLYMAEVNYKNLTVEVKFYKKIPINSEILDMEIYNGGIYISTGDGKIFRLINDSLKIEFSGENYISSFAKTKYGYFFLDKYVDAIFYEKKPLINVKNSTSMFFYNGKIYYNSNGSGLFFEYDLKKREFKNYTLKLFGIISEVRLYDKPLSIVFSLMFFDKLVVADLFRKEVLHIFDFSHCISLDSKEQVIAAINLENQLFIASNKVLDRIYFLLKNQKVNEAEALLNKIDKRYSREPIYLLYEAWILDLKEKWIEEGQKLMQMFYNLKVEYRNLPSFKVLFNWYRKIRGVN